MRNQIPLARGLGSSAAATVAGVIAGNALLGGVLDTAAQLRAATSVEGHPDNAAAVLLGGFVVSAMTPDGVEAVRFDVPRDLRAVLFVPELRLSTDEMRQALPATVPMEDAVANLGAVAVGVGRARHRSDRPAALRLTVGPIHEPYRAGIAYSAAARDSWRPLWEPGASGRCLSGRRVHDHRLSPTRWPTSHADRSGDGGGRRGHDLLRPDPRHQNHATRRARAISGAVAAPPAIPHARTCGSSSRPT
jgi:homoserine kinase